jgi:23S rRNA pseudouridine1911/1915/1917 synthase
MNKTVYTVTSEFHAERLDTFLTSHCELTRSHIQKLIREEMITVNGKIEKPRYKVKERDRIELAIPDLAKDVLIPEEIPLDIVWEDNFIVVVNKPPHMVVYPASGSRSATLMNALAAREMTLCEIGAPLRPGVVHRLDKDTSGLIVIAKDKRAYYELVDQFRERVIEKQYLALVYGNPKEARGEIIKPIGRSSADRKKMSTRTGKGKEAITRYEVVQKFEQAALVKVKILTGRTHQIRVHFASIGHPVLGDKTYGRKTSLRIGQRTLTFPRQMLHAYSLKLKHPLSGEPLEFEAPVPEDMERVIEEYQ